MPLPATTEASRHTLLPIVYLGTDATAILIARLRWEGIGVIVAETVSRGLRLLQQFRVAAVVFALPDLQGAARMAGSQTPVVLLAADDAHWRGTGITVIRRETDAAALAIVIRDVSTGSAPPDSDRQITGPERS